MGDTHCPPPAVIRVHSIVLDWHGLAMTLATLAAANTAESGLIVWPREPHHVGTSRALACRVHSQCRLSHSRMRQGRAVFARPRCLSQYAHLSTSIHTARLYTTLTWDHTGTNMFEFRIPVVCVCGYTKYTYIRYNLLYTILSTPGRGSQRGAVQSIEHIEHN